MASTGPKGKSDLAATSAGAYRRGFTAVTACKLDRWLSEAALLGKANRFQILIPSFVVTTLLVSSVVPAAAETAVEAWVQRCEGSLRAFASVDASNNIIIAGTGRGEIGGFLTVKYSSAGLPLWTNLYTLPSGSTTQTGGMAVDSGDDIIVTGRSRIMGGGATFDSATVKYASTGVPLWTNRYSGNNGSSSDDAAWGIAVDSSDNVIVAGSSMNEVFNRDFLTIKYSSSGVPLWTNRLNGPQNLEDRANAIIVDYNNDIIVTGGAAGLFNQDFMTIKYSRAGIPVWTNLYGGPANSLDSAGLIAVDRSNNVIVAGQSIDIATPTDPYNSDWVIIMYSAAGTPLWTNRYAAGWEEAPSSILVDNADNLIVAGSSGVSYDTYATIKYSNAGVPLWINRFYNGRSSVSDDPHPNLAMAADRSNNIIVAGHSRIGGAHYGTIKYSTAGVPLWTNRYEYLGNYRNAVQAVVCDANDNIIVVGYTGFSPGNPSSTLTNNLVTIKYVPRNDPPVIKGFGLTNGTFQFCVDGLFPSNTLTIEASTNLTEWFPVYTNSATTNSVFYTDSEVSSRFLRFYRAVVLP
jgi:hypothetical protein